MKLAAIVLKVICFFACFPTSLATGNGIILHEKRDGESIELRRGKRVDHAAVMTFKIALKQRNLDRGHEYLMNISHPSSQHYGKTWSAEDVQKVFAPSKETVETVKDWLVSNKIYAEETRGWLLFQSSVGHVEEMLNAKYYEHESREEQSTRIGCDEYFLPDHVARHVDFIQPGVALSPPLQKRSVAAYNPHLGANLYPRRPKLREPTSNPNAGPYSQRSDTRLPPQLRNCGSNMTATCVRALYNLPDPEEVASSYNSNSKNSLGLFEFTGSWNQSDLNHFFRVYSPNIPYGTHPIQAPINSHRNSHPNNQTYTNGETNLDLMVAYPVIYPQKITVYQLTEKVDGNARVLDSAAGFAYVIQEFLDAFDSSFCATNPIPNSSTKDCGTYPPARVISISYGVPEIGQPLAYSLRQCQEFLKLGLQGTTFTISSGDEGVAGRPGYNLSTKGLTNGCLLPGSLNETIRYGQNGTVFNPPYPQSCPYVLSVGATRIKKNETVLDPEYAMDFPYYFHRYHKADFTFTSSGGFSNYFSRPSYQDKAVASYFSNHDPGYPYYNLNLSKSTDKLASVIGANGGLYNRIGRGFPDVSAIGEHVPTFEDGKYFNNGGTSAAAPLWGSVFTLINEKRMQAGKGPVGFVNPVLYEHPEVFNDVTHGDNPGCFTKGFNAVEGWDPITGLGSPNYPKLLELFMSLP